MRKVYAFVLLATGLLMGSNLLAQQNLYLKIAGVDGAVTSAGFEKQIEAFSYSQGNAGCPSGVSVKEAACKAVPSSFHFMIGADPAQIQLKKLLFTGKVIPTATLSLVKSGGDGNPFTYYLIRMENLLIGSIQESGSSEPPFFSLELIPQRIFWFQMVQKQDGSLDTVYSFGWDAAKLVEIPAVL